MKRIGFIFSFWQIHDKIQPNSRFLTGGGGVRTLTSDIWAVAKPANRKPSGFSLQVLIRSSKLSCVLIYQQSMKSPDYSICTAGEVAHGLMEGQECGLKVNTALCEARLCVCVASELSVALLSSCSLWSGAFRLFVVHNIRRSAFSSVWSKHLYSHRRTLIFKWSELYRINQAAACFFL